MPVNAALAGARGVAGTLVQRHPLRIGRDPEVPRVRWVGRKIERRRNGVNLSGGGYVRPGGGELRRRSIGQFGGRPGRETCDRCRRRTSRICRAGLLSEGDRLCPCALVPTPPSTQ